ncbi:MAG TPA: threonine synthase [Actinophytocola sp.]|uniref:threonine synthase n=1 Tax=Actinophytocola sp. TaxID=1872138 RepID=UPI002DDD24ED|nr:threonine synthase [Actinophytocola sp.]HEV2781727.1 threonine synthase [Actinophytocola sp.]
MAYSALDLLRCPACGAEHDADRVTNLCGCGSPLLAAYRLDRITVAREEIAGRPPTLWRYHELLPVRAPENVLSLGEGMTPLVALPRLGAEYGVPRLLMKDEGLIPTGTFKARGAAVGASRARELGVTGIAMPTNGNAGAAWATYAARGGMRSLIAMPTGAPLITRRECAIAGAELHIVDGHIGQCGQLIARELERRPGFQDVSTLKEPYRLEGKKTMGLELAEQLGWRAPDVILYPTGGGVGLIGIHKAMLELRDLGWLNGTPPRLVAVQSTGCAPVVRAFEQRATHAEPWPDPHTVAFGLTVPKPLGDRLILDALYATNGTAIAVPDEEILAEQSRCARLEGAFLCPEGAATLAAVRHLRTTGWLSEDDEVVVLNTGAGIKYPEVGDAT